jgi:hypothetical protein
MDLSAKFVNDVVAVIGLGGTGAYVLDFLVKTPVREIRAFDPDVFHVHNVFRSTGRLDESELGKPKTDVYGGRSALWKLPTKRKRHTWSPIITTWAKRRSMRWSLFPCSKAERCRHLRHSFRTTPN